MPSHASPHCSTIVCLQNAKFVSHQPCLGCRLGPKPYFMCSHSLLLVALLLSIATCRGQSSNATNATNAGDVDALLSFKSALTAGAGPVASWVAGVDPCGAPSCSAGSCNWKGIACSDWRVTELQLGCTLMNECLAGTLSPQLSGLTELTKLDLSNNEFTGKLPPSYGNLTSLRDLRVAGNKLSGQLPNRIGDLQQLQLLDVSFNELTGPLPPDWGTLAQLTLLTIESNSMSGSVPLVWVGMTSLQVLNVRANCGICGALPPFRQEFTETGLLVLARGSSLGWACSSTNCASFPLGFVGQAAIVVAVVVLMATMCCWRRCYLFRRHPRSEEEGQGWGLVRSVLSLQRAPHPPRRGDAAEDEDDSAAPPRKVEPPIVVVMPDGSTLCTARLDPEAPLPSSGLEPGEGQAGGLQQQQQTGEAAEQQRQSRLDRYLPWRRRQQQEAGGGPAGQQGGTAEGQGSEVSVELGQLGQQQPGGQPWAQRYAAGQRDSSSSQAAAAGGAAASAFALAQPSASSSAEGSSRGRRSASNADEDILPWINNGAGQAGRAYSGSSEGRRRRSRRRRHMVPVFNCEIEGSVEEEGDGDGRPLPNPSQGSPRGLPQSSQGSDSLDAAARV